MTWYLIALIGPFLYAITNHVDRFLLEKYFKEGGVGTLIIYSSILSVLALPFIVMGDPTVLSTEKENIFYLAIVGILNILVIWFYLQAIAIDEASIIVIFYQLVPVFAGILSYIFLDEVITTSQMVAMAIIIFGTSLVAIDFDENNSFFLRKKTILFMCLASTCWAIESVLFKAVALDENVWRSLFWEHVMMGLFGLLILIFVTHYRKQFMISLRENSKAILSLNITNESIYILGNNVVAFAYIMAPLALVLLFESFQSIFVLLIAILLNWLFPKLTNDKVDSKHLLQKLLAILVTGYGTYLLLGIS